MAKCPFKKTRKDCRIKEEFPANTFNLLSKEGLHGWLNAMGYTPENSFIMKGTAPDGSDAEIIYGRK